MSDAIKSTKIERILELVEKGVIEFVKEPVQTEEGYEYTFKLILNQTEEDKNNN